MSPEFKKDTIFSLPMDELVDFSFDENIVSVFPDMVNRSVPGYSLMQSLTGLIASARVSRQSRVYDLGCSLGASSLAILNSVEHQDYELYLVDQSQAMMQRCEQLLARSTGNVVTRFLTEDLRHVNVERASLVLLNLVLQFLPVEDRQGCINAIYNGLQDTGVLLLSEKIQVQSPGQDGADQAMIDELYLSFKRRSGYSDLEISQKRQALENVMQPETIEVHRQRLKNAGFSRVLVLMQALNFVSMLAIK